MAASKEYSIYQNNIEIMSIVISIPDNTTYENIQWDSKTGLVTANVNGNPKRTPINYTGKAFGKIEPGPFETKGIYNMEYNYWYY